MLRHHPDIGFSAGKEEDIEKEPAALLENYCRHLRLEDIYREERSLLRQRLRPGVPMTINPKLEAVLYDLYDKKLSSLERFLGRDLSPWRSLWTRSTGGPEERTVLP